MEMVKAELISLALAAALSCGCASSPSSFEWKRIPADGSRTGVTAPNAVNVPEALGTVDGNVYLAPSGKQFRRGATPDAAKIMIDVQPDMARLKEVIATSARVMEKHRPESGLSSFAVDVVMRRTAAETGKKVDVGIMNFGGIRCALPEGPVILDDIVSMFPFRNNLVYIAMPGYELRRVFQQMAENRVEVIGGAKLVIKDRKLVSAEVGGKPLSDSAVYGLATIDFLLDGGDKLYLARNSREMIITDVRVMDAIEPEMRAYGERGEVFDYPESEGRVTIVKEDR